jgi:hypothetical protein
MSMPLGDRTGPLGLGPRTGRGLGYCAGYGVPGYLNPIGRGLDTVEVLGSVVVMDVAMDGGALGMRKLSDTPIDTVTHKLMRRQFFQRRQRRLKKNSMQ